MPFSFDCPYCHEKVDVVCTLIEDREENVLVVGPPQYEHPCSATGTTLRNDRFLRYSGS